MVAERRARRRRGGRWFGAARASAAVLLGVSCGDAGPLTPDDPTAPEEPAGPDEPAGVLVLPVVVHVVHGGEPSGVGANLSEDRIRAQIRILNEDFRRKPGTRGHNTHPDGGDARIEFALAEIDPAGAPTTGIVRYDGRERPPPEPPVSLFDHYASFGYWDPDRYVNVWTMPLSAEATDVVLGFATGPETDLPGADLFTPGEPVQAEGILVNAAHFGPSGSSSLHGLGRTLTHEMGHYLGLLHPWGSGDCDTNDFCADTPAMSESVLGCPVDPPLGCGGVPVMIENYMGWAGDACMSTFTKDQIARMRHVLEHSPRRIDLARSPGLVRAQ